MERTGKRGKKKKKRGWSEGANTSSRKRKKKTFFMAFENFLKTRLNYKASLKVSRKQMAAFQCPSLTCIPR